jgi:threonine/homoserine/homoserine lactone efflux protein
MWCTPVAKLEPGTPSRIGIKKQFLEGLTIQLTNPKAVFFFMAIFPQFVDFSSDYARQFTLLVLTYSSLNLIIHFLYALLAKSARGWLSSDKGKRKMSRIGGGIFILFSIGLASSSR